MLRAHGPNFYLLRQIGVKNQTMCANFWSDKKFGPFIRLFVCDKDMGTVYASSSPIKIRNS